jgi:hypothetical protein
MEMLILWKMRVQILDLEVHVCQCELCVSRGVTINILKLYEYYFIWFF